VTSLLLFSHPLPLFESSSTADYPFGAGGTTCFDAGDSKRVRTTLPLCCPTGWAPLKRSAHSPRVGASFLLLLLYAPLFCAGGTFSSCGGKPPLLRHASGPRLCRLEVASGTRSGASLPIPVLSAPA
jgi:hypothetical protein